MSKELVNVQVSINEWRNMDKLSKLPRDKTYKFEIVEESSTVLKKKKTLGGTEPDIFDNNNKDKLDAYKIGAVINFQVELEKVGNKYKEKKLRLLLLWGSKGSKAWSSQSIKPNECFVHEGELNTYDREDSCKFEKASSYLLYTILIWPSHLSVEEARKKANEKGVTSIKDKRKSFAQSSFNLKLTEGYDPVFGNPLESPRPMESPLSARGHSRNSSGSLGSMGSMGSMVFQKEEELPEVYQEARKEFLKKSKQDTNSSIQSLQENITLQEKKAEAMPETIKQSLETIEKEMDKLHKEKKKEHRKLEDSMEDIESDKIEIVSSLDEWKSKKQKIESEHFDLLNPLEKKQTELKVTHDKMEGQKKNATLLLTQKLTTKLVASQNEINRIQKIIDEETQEKKEFNEDIKYMTGKIEEFKIKSNDLEIQKKKAIEQKENQISKLKGKNEEKEKEIQSKETIYIKSLDAVKKEYEEQKKILDKSLEENTTMKNELKPLKDSILTHEKNKIERIEKNIIKNTSKIVKLKIHDSLNKSEETFLSTLQSEKSNEFLNTLENELSSLEEKTKPLQKEFEEISNKRIELSGKLLIKRKQKIDGLNDNLEKRKLLKQFEKDNELIKKSRMKSLSVDEMESLVDEFNSEFSTNKKIAAIKSENIELKKQIKKKNPEEALLTIEEAKTSIAKNTDEIKYQQIKIQENEKRLKEVQQEIEEDKKSDFDLKFQELLKKVEQVKKIAKEKNDKATSLEKIYEQKLNEKKKRERKIKEIENEIEIIDRFTRQTGEAREVKLNVIKTTEAVEEAEYIIEPLISLKGGITKFLKEINKKCLDLKGKTISDILTSDDTINDRIEHLILKPFIHILNHGFLIGQWYFTTGHVWRMFEVILPHHEKLFKIFDLSIKMVDNDIKMKNRDGLSTTKIYDFYLKVFLVICLEEKLLISLIEALVDLETIDVYFQNTAILHTPNDVIKLKKIVAVLSKIPFHFSDQLFFMQERRKLKDIGSEMYSKMKTRYSLFDGEMEMEMEN
eukprot:gene2209-2383_t